MSLLDKKMIAFANELNDLKNAPARSPSEIGTKTQEITTSCVIGGTSEGGVLRTQPKRYGIVRVDMDEPGFATAAVVTDPGQRRIGTRHRSTAGYKEIAFWIERGSPEDAAELNGNWSNEKTISITVKITATCEFTLTQYQSGNLYND